MMSKDFAIFKSGFAPFLMKTSKNCQGKTNEKIRSYDFGKVMVRRSQRPRWSCLPSCQKIGVLCHCGVYFAVGSGGHLCVPLTWCVHGQCVHFMCMPHAQCVPAQHVPGVCLVCAWCVHGMPGQAHCYF